MKERLLTMEKKERLTTINFNRPEKLSALSPLALFHPNDLLNFSRKNGKSVASSGAGHG